MAGLNALEIAVLMKLFDGDIEGLSALRAQVFLAQVTLREMTGVGFYTTFIVPSEAPRAPLRAGTIIFGDVQATLPELKNGAGFLVYIEDGMLHMLEGYANAESWPGEVGDIFELRYSDISRQSVVRALHRSPSSSSTT